MRILQSVLFESTPLQVDSLNQNWATILSQIAFRGTTRIGISTTTLQEEETKVFSTGAIPHTLSDTLAAHYIGYRSEIEITGIIYYSWWSLLLGGDIILLSGVMVLFIAFVLLYEKRRWIYQRYVAKRAPIVLESNVFVNAVGSDKTHIYKIGEVCFDTNSNLLSRGEFLSDMVR